MPASKSDENKGVLEEALRIRKEREKTYRERALKILPHVCARCGREFSGKRLRELTVHHKDHNHDNNPPDGSNWELLCLYCHENEHARDRVAEAYDAEPVGESSRDDFRHNPFAGLANLMTDKKTG
jgi:5-methylcytosine-specific restriction endonuclease McrA